MIDVKKPTPKSEQSISLAREQGLEIDGLSRAKLYKLLDKTHRWSVAHKKWYKRSQKLTEKQRLTQEIGHYLRLPVDELTPKQLAKKVRGKGYKWDTKLQCWVMKVWKQKQAKRIARARGEVVTA